MQNKKMTYKDAGVDINAGNRSVEKIKGLVSTTFNPNVLKGIGHFGAMYKIPLSGYDEPVLISSIDGVGTKLKVAIKMQKHDTIGEDLVNHCVNDILTSGARPLFFLDYLSLGEVTPEIVKEIVKGIVRGCKRANCALIGGETAEMTDLYQPGDFDLAGTIVGIVEKSKIIDGSNIQTGDKLIGLKSNGLHTNGYTLARKILFEKHKLDVNFFHIQLNQTIGEALLEVHRNYFHLVNPIIKNYDIHGLAHITGGGIYGNTKRVVSKSLKLIIDWESWDRPSVFNVIQDMGGVPEHDMRRTFNLGIGFVIITSEKNVKNIRNDLKNAGEESVVIGGIISGK